MSTATTASAREFRAAPGSVIEVRDEQWLVTGGGQDGDGYLLRSAA